MFTLHTGKAAHELDPDGKTILAVPFSIVDADGKIVHALKQAFPIGATADEIRAALEQHLAIYTEDHKRHESVKEHQAQLETSSAAAEEISNITI